MNGHMDFDEYIVASEPHKRERAEAWKVAIGLQAVDGLQVSEYLKQTARRHIEGEITIDEAKELVKQYYVSKTKHDDDEDDKQEADRVSINITKIINERAFTFSTTGLISIHRNLFSGVFKHAGQLRDYDITKNEWVLRGDTVLYGRWQDLRMALDYDIEKEKQFDYKGLSMEEVITHLSRFVSGIWQTHPFREGNTRTTAVFTIKYLQSIGFKADNRMFEEHSWYFRNALVRANYKNVAKGISQDGHFLELFFRNLLMGENNELKNRYLLVNPPEEWKQPTSRGQVQDKYRTSVEGSPKDHRRIVEGSSSGHRTSAGQAQDMLHTDNPNIQKLILVVGEQELSVKEMMSGLRLKGRDNFLNVYLTPAITDGYVRLLYPQSPRHPRQKYLLTVKGGALYNELTKGE
ncbi:MAG: Fic family protein [Bacteroidales bacterium]|nr:Fic family protein [Bacteroidales bacterium]